MNTDRKMVVRFVGNFPPPFGGVTIKNDLLYRKLDSYFRIKKINSSSKLKQLFWFIGCCFTKNKMVIGVSSKTGKSLKLTQALYYLNKKRMRKSLYFMMGGTESKRISSSTKEIKFYSCYKRIYVEMDSMKKELENVGLKNVEIYPNCREKIIFDKEKHTDFKCVYFSLISKMKGADITLEAAKLNPNIDFYFYGPIDIEYENEFKEKISELSNAIYMGVYKSNQKELYFELSKYDVLIFPTMFKTEGIPGVLVETKFAGIPAIVSDVSYNAEIVKDGIDGIVIKSENVFELNNSINTLYLNKNYLNNLKNGASDSSNYYDIDNYLNGIINNLLG